MIVKVYISESEVSSVINSGNKEVKKHWVIQGKRGLDWNKVIGNGKKFIIPNILVEFSFLKTVVL
jgi:hypothetical protein